MTGLRTLTVRDIAEDLQLTEGTIQAKLRAQTIPGATLLFGEWRVDAEIYEDWRAGKFGPAPASYVKDPHGFAPRSARSRAARKAAANR